jgi:small-conductance mechanosensitive channel
MISEVAPMIRLALASLAVLLILLGPPSARAQGDEDIVSAAPVASTVTGGPAETAPVTLDGFELFRIRGTSARPAAERARLIANQIRKAAADPAVDPDALTILESETSTDVMAGNRVLIQVVDADAAVEGLRRAIIAAVFHERIAKAIRDYRHDREPTTLRANAIYTVLTLIALVLGLLVLHAVRRALDRLISRRFRTQIETVEKRSFDLLDADQIVAITHRLARALVWVTAATMIVFWATTVLSLFPWTRPVGNRALALLLAPLATMGQAILGYLPDLAFLAVLFVVVRWLLGLVRVFFDSLRVERIRLRSFDPEWAVPTLRIVRLGIIVLAIVVAYPYIPGSGSEAFRGVSILLGVLVSIGSSSVVSNMIAGYSLIYRRTFKIGDRVKIGDVVGDVIDMRLQVTHLRSPKKEEIVVPNSHILGSNVVNYTTYARRGGVLLHTTLGIGYEVPWRQVEAMLCLAAERTEGLLKQPAPFVLIRALNSFDVTYELNVLCGEAQAMARRYAELHRNILDVFNENGVQIMTPAYESDPSDAKIVAKEDWHKAPA